MTVEEENYERRIKVDVYHHFHGPVEIKIVDANGNPIHMVFTPATPQVNQ